MDQPIQGCLIVIGILGALGAAVALIAMAIRYHDERNRTRAEALGSLAARWNGRVTSGYYAADHQLSLNVDGIPGEVTFHPGSKPDKAWTRLQFDCPTARRLRVVPESFSGWLSRLFGGGDIKIGDPRFDEAFWIESSDAAWARELLDAPLRARITTLREKYYGFGRNTVTLDIGPAGVSLRLGAILLDERAGLEHFIASGVEALRRVRGGAVAGVEFAAVEIRGGSECPVCGHAVHGGTKCPSCGTPHHADCWKYSAGCAMFGCAGRPSGPRRAA